MSDKVTRAPEDHANRCQAASRLGQCPNFAIRDAEGNFIGKNCFAHGGASQLTAHKKANMRRYNLGKWHERVGELASDPGIKSLREDIGILRLLVEERMKSISSDLDLVKNSGPIGEMVLRIEKLVVSCQKLEEKMGASLDKSAVIALADQILEILITAVENAACTKEQQETILTVVSQGMALLLKGPMPSDA